MDVENLRELMEAKLALMQIQIDHTNEWVKNTNERLDKVINNLKWVLGIMIPVLTVVLQTLISKFLP